MADRIQTLAAAYHRTCIERDQARARVTKLEEAIRQVLEDEESQEGGWGPDVTMVAVLKEALGA